MSIFLALGLGLAAGWLSNWFSVWCLGRFVTSGRYGLSGDLAAGVLGALLGDLLAGRVVPLDSGVSLPCIALVLLGAYLAIGGLRVMTVDGRSLMRPH